LTAPFVPQGATVATVTYIVLYMLSEQAVKYVFVRARVIP